MSSGDVTSFLCPVCQNKNNTRVQFSDRPVDMTVVKTACQPDPHIYHLGCISQHLESTTNERKCMVCKQDPLPLIRADGAKVVEDSPYCESSALTVCRRGDVASLNELLDEVPEAATEMFHLAKTGEMISLLSMAAGLGHSECVRALINKGADDLHRALVEAADGEHVECIKVLLEERAGDLSEAVTQSVKQSVSNVDFVRLLSEKGCSDATVAQMMAIRSGNSESLQVAIENGTPDLDTLTHYCANLGHAQCMQVLIDNGAKPAVCSLLAAYFGHADIIRVVLNNFSPDDIDLQLPLFAAAEFGKSDCLGFVLEHMENISADTLKHAVKTARRKGHTECVKLLEETMSRIDDLDETGSEADIALQDNAVSTSDDDTQSETNEEDTIGSSWSCVVV